MKVISTFVHGIIDYLGALVFYTAPEIFGFADGPAAAVAVARILGVVSLLYSVGTDYELGLFRVLSMRAHLAIDYVVALTFLLSPFVFGFFNGPTHHWLPHLGAAAFVAVVTTLTRTEPSSGAAV
jgi:Kef-type K+ transport system membrane component KefB